MRQMHITQFFKNKKPSFSNSKFKKKRDFQNSIQSKKIPLVFPHPDWVIVVSVNDENGKTDVTVWIFVVHRSSTNREFSRRKNKKK